MRFLNQTVVITGGTTGLGFASAERFLAEGAKVIVTGQNQERLDAAVAKLGPGATGVLVDVRNLSQLDELARRVKDEFGAVDVLFANAGVGTFAPFETVTEENFDFQFDVNVKGLFFTVQKLAPVLKDGASIVLNASAVHGKGVGAGTVYFATKAAVRSLARTLATALGPRRIRVNTVSPGFVPTEFQGKMGMPEEALAGFEQMIVSTIPLARVGTPVEIANAVLFLASQDSSYMTAADVMVDGGFGNV